MVTGSFQFAGTPFITFGSGTVAKLVDALPKGTRRVLFVMGSFQRSNAAHWEKIVASLEANDIGYDVAHIHEEPTVAWVDDVVNRCRAGSGGVRSGAAGTSVAGAGAASGNAVADAMAGGSPRCSAAASGEPQAVDAVVAIGGGSAMDAGKAVSAMLTTAPGDTVLHYLENQPLYRPHSGSKVFFVAVPTTSGTGSEMTKNAVVSIPGGFKRSIRHDRFIPDAALVDPQLTISCPTAVKAASGLDALTQLIESYVSTKASPLTDALALSGMEAAAKALLPICSNAAEDAALHEQMAYASMLSGITLAHAGLGLVHGFAAPVGGSFPVPHGVVCGTLLAEVTKRNIVQLRRESGDTAALGLAKYAKVGALLTGYPLDDIGGCCDRLVAVLEDWTEQLGLPRLGRYGLTPDNINGVLDATDNKQSPVQLDRAAMREILLARM